MALFTIFFVSFLSVSFGERTTPHNCSELLIDGDTKIDNMLMLINKHEMGYKDVKEFERDYCR
jgi:hypothetical protein